MILIKTKPISVNKLYRGKRFTTNEGKAIKEAMAWEVKLQWPAQPDPDIKEVTIRFFLDSNRPDIDNYLKGLLDCIAGIIWENDRQIDTLHVYKYKDTANPRIEIEVTKNPS